MKRFVLVLIAVFALLGAFAQKEIPLSYTLNPEKAVSFPLYLRGPSTACQPILLNFDATYFPDDDLINVTIHYKYEKPLLRKNQYTHLWFPMSINETTFGEFSFEDHFKRNFRSAVALNEPIRAQVRVSQTGDLFQPAFQCIHGQLMNQKDLDVMVSLNEGKVIVLKIKVLDNNKPVILKLNNVVPLRARFNFPMIFNKSKLDYISNNYAITLRLPEGGCYGLTEVVSQYKRWNDELKTDYENLLNYLIDNRLSQTNKNEELRKRLQILSKYEPARKGLREVDCEELRREFTTFRTFYNKVADGVISADSIQHLINKLDELIDGMSIARNTGNGKTCKALKDQASQYTSLQLDESVYGEFPEMLGLVQRFNERVRMINSIKCPGGGSGGGGGGGGNSGRCNIDPEKIKSATTKINDLLNAYRKNKTKNEQTFNSIVRETDNYLKGFSDACKNNKKYQTIIYQYQEAKKAYQNAVK